MDSISSIQSADTTVVNLVTDYASHKLMSRYPCKTFCFWRWSADESDGW